MPNNGATAVKRPGPQMTLESLNAKNADPGTKDVKNRIKAWQQDDGPAMTSGDGVARMDMQNKVAPKKVPMPKKETTPKKELAMKTEDPSPVKETVLRTRSASPTKKEFAVIQDEETGRVQGIKITTPSKSQRSPAPKPGAAQFDPEKRAWVRKPATKPQREIQDDLMHAGMPKKRVVSDGHWRKDASPPKKDSPPKIALEQPKKIAAQKSTPNFKSTSTPKIDSRLPSSQPRPFQIREAPKDRPKWRIDVPSQEPEFKVRRTRDVSRSRSRERGGPTSSVNVERHGAKKAAPIPTKDFAQTPYTIRRTSAWDNQNRPESAPAKQKQTRRRTPPRHEPDVISSESDDTVMDHGRRRSSGGRRRHRRRHRRSSTPPSLSEVSTKDQSSIVTPAPDDSISRRGLPTEPVQRKASEPMHPRPSLPREYLQRRTPPTEQETQKTSPSMPVKPVPMQSQTYGNRIEAWLGGQTDPFVDDASASIKSDPVRVSSTDPERMRNPLHRRTSAGNDNMPVMSGGLGHSPNDKENKPDAYAPTSSGKRSGDRKSPRSASRESPSSYGTERESADRPGTETLISMLEDKSKQAQAANLRKTFPTTGRPLSTIASEATFDVRVNQIAPSIIEEEATQPRSRVTNANGLNRKTTGLKRRLTKHDDLMSVLSLSREEAPSLVSARSIRTHRTKLDSATIDNVLAELAADEAKYQRELRTLVDGVIPVLLSSVLSKSSSEVTAKLFGPSKKPIAAVTQPIVDMGIALERLKSSHKRMPQTDSQALIKWAQTASKVYADFIRAWRMGFDDVVVNLAPPDPADKKDERWDDGLPRNDNGDLLNGDGERVDVAFLLKRPLLRVKYLAKTFRGINHLSPSGDAEAMADRYQELVVEARKKSNEERARLEDEAAAAIDPTRARDPKTLAPLAGVTIDPMRCVRARDYFDMSLKHSSGQRLDCKVEIVIRDNVTGAIGAGGDVLFCEISETGRWLLFPPVLQDMISARISDENSNIIVLIRGFQGDASEWSEVLTLQTSEIQAAEEWVAMIGAGPVPPSPTKTEFTFNDESQLSPGLTETTESTFAPARNPTLKQRTNRDDSPELLSPRSERPTVTFKSRTPSPKEVEVPIGEPARKTSKKWSEGLAGVALDLLGQATPGMQRKSRPNDISDEARRPVSMPSGSPVQRASTPGAYSDAYAFTDKTAAKEAEDSGSPIRRSKATKHRRGPSTRDSSKYDRERSSESAPPESGRPHLQRSELTEGSTVAASSFETSTSSSSKKDFSVWLPSTSSQLSDYSDDSGSDYSDDEYGGTPPASRPAMHRRTSSVPARDLPLVNKLRKPSAPQTPPREQHKRNESEPLPETRRDEPSSAPAKLQKPTSSAEKESKPRSAETTPKLKTSILPSLTPNFLKRNRRPSSPLKHEYAPSPSDSETDSASDYSTDDDETGSMTSDSELSVEGDEHIPTAKSPQPVGLGIPDFKRIPKVTPPQSVASLEKNTLAPSSSASQAPFRQVPTFSTHASKTAANIFSWADTMQGGWENLHPHEVRVVVTAGLIEAFDMAEAHSVPQIDKEGVEVSPSQHGIKPIVALELTPLVPLRRGTALDISIRSPPTINSKIRSSSNVMFRSRSPEECEALYNLINQARINNATYIALQNARGPFSESTWAAAMDKRNAMRSASSSSSWWNLGSKRGSTYRSNTTRTRPASIANSESSVGTMSSAFSALRRFSGADNSDASPGKRFFNIARSSVTSRQQYERKSTLTGSSDNSARDTLSSGYSTPNPYGSAISPAAGAGGPVPTAGVSNMKIRLYIRETASKWRDLGSARLSILDPARPPLAPGQPAPVLPTLNGQKQKRVVVQGTTKGETLLDVTLDEQCFERVARTGIALSVFGEDLGLIKAIGGVGGRELRVFMLQLKSERDAAYTFSLVGKLRY